MAGGWAKRIGGGLAQKARLNGNWLVPLPAQFTPQQAMAIGTAGYTAMLCVLALERHGVTPAHGEILVTGAAGGVGSVATAVLSRLGYTVVAVSGRPAETEYLKHLGAVEVLDRATFATPGKPLGRERWAGAVDVVGSHTLANVCATTRYRGVVTARAARSMETPGQRSGCREAGHDQPGSRPDRRDSPGVEAAQRRGARPRDRGRQPLT